MTLDAGIEGKAYPPISWAADPERVRAFAEAVAYRSAGLPPTIVTVPEIAAGLANAVADHELGVELARVLHGEQEYEWLRPLTEGETLTATARIESLRARGAMRFVTLRTELRDASEALVVVGRSTLIVRGQG